MNISIAAETLWHMGGIPVTNTLIITLLVSFFVIGVSLFAGRKKSLIPRGLQNVAEVTVEGMWNLTNDVVQERELAKKVFPLVATLFLFILFSNWIELIPGLGTIGLREEHEVIPFIRSSSADLNMTIALALIAVFSIQFIGIATLGMVKYGKKFFISPFHKPYGIGTIVGLLELLGEAVKIISFSFRLFGNIFAGEVLLIVMLNLMPYIVPLPFLLMELFVGFIQAVVFAMLTLVFLKMATVEMQH